MKITGIHENSQLVSEDSFCFFAAPVELPNQFWVLIKKGRGHKRFPHRTSEVTDNELIESFEQWIRSQPRQKVQEGEVFSKVVCGCP